MLSWVFDLDKKNFHHTACNFFCKHMILVARLDNSDYWFLPDRCSYTSITLQTFVKHIRHLAKHFDAKVVYVTTLDKIDVHKGVFFQYTSLFSSDILSADKSNWDFVFKLCDFGKSVLFCGVETYPSQLFHNLPVEDLKVHSV